ncbi:MAG TPA: hypothetical protein VF299_08590 [Mycobacterium sp.]
MVIELFPPDARADGVPARLPRDWTWVNWVLTLSTAAAAALVMTYALSGALSVGGCSTAGCPDLGANAPVFNMLFYGAAVVAVAVMLGSFFTARRPAGIILPLSGWALLVADVAALAVTFG